MRPPTSNTHDNNFIVHSIQILGSSTVNLAAFAQDQAYLAGERANVNIKRHGLSLFDAMKNEVVRLDVTMGVSLMERGEGERLAGKLERVHPTIPNV
jgi:hypothetical protein